MITFVPTPIGNLEDISKRSLSALENAKLILCEDTRITKKLLHLLSEKFQINFNNKEFKSLHSHNESNFLKTIDIKEFKEKNIVYVSDAGMPCVSDPGSLLVDFCIQNGIPFDVIPGANALLTAYAMSGFDNKSFTFYGFLPHKEKNRVEKLQKLLQSEYTTILYESPHRLLKLLENLSALDENRIIFLVKEITKLHQNYYKGTSKEIYENLKKSQIKGEWVVVIEAKKYTGQSLSLDDINSLDLPPKQKAKLISKMTGRAVKEVYQQLLGRM